MTDPTAAHAARLAEACARALLCAPDGLGVGALSRMLGESREAVSEALSGLRAAGLVEVAERQSSDIWFASFPVPRGRVRLPVHKMFKRNPQLQNQGGNS